MSVEAGAPENFNVEQKLQRQTMEERRLAEMMIPKKKKRLYDKIMYSKKKKSQEVRADKLVQTSCCLVFVLLQIFIPPQMKFRVVYWFHPVSLSVCL